MFFIFDINTSKLLKKNIEKNQISKIKNYRNPKLFFNNKIREDKSYPVNEKPTFMEETDY